VRVPPCRVHVGDDRRERRADRFPLFREQFRHPLPAVGVRAVVGSSATRTSGSLTHAMAMAAR
jgi:hypothetical protein